jgi:outer membrane lipoprotein SlyB
MHSETTNSRTLRNRHVRRLGFAALLGAGTLLSGCSNAGEGALSGGALGAGLGAIVGSMYADAGKGALIGAAAGAVGGAVVGDQNERQDRRARGEFGYYR